MKEGILYGVFAIMKVPDITVSDMLLQMYDNNYYPVALITDRENEVFKESLQNKPENSPDVLAILIGISFSETFKV